MVSRVNADGSLRLRSRLVVPASEIELRVTTSGGPGGQHANRSLTKVVALFNVEGSTCLSEADRAWLLERCGSVVQSSSRRHRSQSQNRAAALENLARKLVEALARPTPRRATRPTAASRLRRVESKKARSRVKEARRRVED